MSEVREALRGARRWVVKIGSALLTDNGQGLALAAFDQWVAQIAALKNAGHDVVLVSSGAVAEGMTRLGWHHRPDSLHQLQAAAAVGQAGLIQAWEARFNQYQLTTAQVLLVHEDLSSRTRYLNARQTLQSLLQYNVIPIVNENDTVATSEIRFGDNDRLSARVATMVDADLLILLSDVDGLFTGDPSRPDAKFIDVVEKITPTIESMANGPVSKVGTGGMVTKLAAAKIATQAGTEMVIASGKRLNPITSIDDNRYTLFKCRASRKSARKQWIAGDLSQVGSIAIDQGAVRAIAENKSLLPVGVVEIRGEFERGDVVEVINPENAVVGRGLSAYSATEAKQIIGRQANAIFEILGYDGPENIIHRDDMVVFDNE